MTQMMRYAFVALLGLLVLASNATSASATEIKPFERGSWQAIRAAHAGRPTLVHFWGVTCGPCKVELPELGKFAKAHPGIDVVMIDADLVPNSIQAVTAMLTKAGLDKTERWMFGDSYAERLRYEIDPKWQGDIPRTLLIAVDGTITTIEGSADISNLEKWAASEGKK
ncbi:hypothetical protein CRBSH125_02550 [Afipia carboxidovorans]|nr:hypothetical protein CRBSH125_02550 [Afipia carboxidovorans]